MARKSRVREENFQIIYISIIFRAFLASPILRELSTVKQENKLIKVKSRKKNVC
jgi:hypothetical protein